MTELETAILALFTPKGQPLSAAEVRLHLGQAYSREEISAALEALTRTCALMSTHRSKYALPAALGLEAGTFWSSGRGFGFVTPDGGGEDYFIPPRATGDAWHGDRVLIRAGAEAADRERRTAAVEKILSRANRTVTGRLVRDRKQSHLEPDNKRLPARIAVPPSKTHGAKGGDKVAISLLTFGDRRKVDAMGSVQAVFGRDGTREAASAAVLYHYDIKTQFPEKVSAAARAVPAQVPSASLEGRLDLRDRIIFTIDGADAKDLDDAVSLERTEDGNFRLGVHIADVSHYVEQDSPIDREAWGRGTSVYFADRVIPMLPVELSNGICSLNPRQDRLALTAFMTMTPEGAVLDHSIHKSVIRTAERMTYDDCNALLAGGNPALEARYADILPSLREMAKLAAALERKRTLRGAITLRSTESKILCDGEGRPLEIAARPRGVSEHLIEEFMLAANETVAEHMSRLELPMVYRVHEKPSAEKLENFTALAAAFGYSLRDTSSFSMQAILDAAAGRPEEAVINDLLLHSMMKAKYSVSNLGHFGLAAEFYCHFTSPIRRYPDLMVHRLLTLLLDGKLKGQPQQRFTRLAADAAAQSSEREVAAESAEREIEKLYKAEYMQAHLGEVFDSVVSGVQRYGVFVMLESGVEGLIPVASLEEDEYDFDEKRLTLTGVRTRRQFRYGMPLRVRCVAADSSSGQIDFHLTGPDTPENPE